MKDIEVNFPLIEDISMEVSKQYGMIQPGESSTQAVRAVFFIDPELLEQFYIILWYW
ncbi:MAG: redoxin domain-containing protein [Flavobacterium haoranii]